MAEITKQVRLDSSVMFPMMELFEESEMTQKQFCVEMDHVPHTFTYWLNKYRNSKQQSRQLKSKSHFIGLDVRPSVVYKSSERMMRISYPNGAIIELPV